MAAPKMDSQSLQIKNKLAIFQNVCVISRKFKYLFVKSTFLFSLIGEKSTLNSMQTPTTAKEIILSLPYRFRKEKCQDAGYNTLIHFDIEGDNGGKFTVTIQDATIEVKEGLNGTPKCTVKAKESVYSDIEWGKQNPQMAFMMGKVKVDNPMELMTFSGMFRTLAKAFGA